VSVARALLEAIAPASTPLCLLTRRPPLERPQLQDPFQAAGSVGGPAFLRLLRALEPLQPAQRRRAGVPVLGAWCAAAPVWGNPLLVPEGSRLGLEWHYPSVLAAFAFDTLRSAYLYRAAFPGWRWYAPEPRSALALHRLKQHLKALWAAVPPAWQDYVRAMRASSPGFSQARDGCIDEQPRRKLINSTDRSMVASSVFF
jgi:hypothetical protein